MNDPDFEKWKKAVVKDRKRHRMSPETREAINNIRSTMNEFKKDFRDFKKEIKDEIKGGFKGLNKKYARKWIEVPVVAVGGAILYAALDKLIALIT